MKCSILARGALRASKRNTRRQSEASEKRAAATHKGRVQPGSGALPVAAFKGDVITKDWLIEDKVTGKKSFSVTLAMWKKIRAQAFGAGKRKPLLRVSLDEGRTTLVVLNEYDFEELCETAS